MGRYLVERLRNFDPKSRTETWIPTNISSDSLQMLIDYKYLKPETRIIDTVTGKEMVRGDFNPDDWKE